MGFCDSLIWLYWRARSHFFQTANASVNIRLLVKIVILLYLWSPPTSVTVKKNSGFWIDYFLRYLSLKTVLNFLAAILELIWSRSPKIKMAVSQKLFKIQISNFRFFLLSGRGTIGMKIKKIRDQSAWAIRWNDMEWPIWNIISSTLAWYRVNTLLFLLNILQPPFKHSCQENGFSHPTDQ